MNPDSSFADVVTCPSGKEISWNPHRQTGWHGKGLCLPPELCAKICSLKPQIMCGEMNLNSHFLNVRQDESRFTFCGCCDLSFRESNFPEHSWEEWDCRGCMLLRPCAVDARKICFCYAW